MKRLMTMMAGLVLLLVGCNTPETADVPDGTRAHERNLTTGRSESSATTEEIRSQVGGAYMGSNTQSSVDARATRQTNSTASGPAMKGFDFGGAATFQAVMSAIETDPVVVALKESLAGEADPARKDALIAQLATYVGKLRSEATKMGGDLSGLSRLTVVNVIGSYTTGADQKPLTDAEAQAGAALGSEAIKTAREQ